MLEWAFPLALGSAFAYHVLYFLFGCIVIRRAGDHASLYQGIGALGRTTALYWSHVAHILEKCKPAKGNRLVYNLAMTLRQPTGIRTLTFAGEYFPEERPRYLHEFLHERIGNATPLGRAQNTNNILKLT